MVSKGKILRELTLTKGICLILIINIAVLLLIKFFFITKTFGFPQGDPYEYAQTAYHLVFNNKLVAWDVRNIFQSIFFTPAFLLLKIFAIPKGNVFLMYINSQSLIYNLLSAYVLFLIVKRIRGSLAGLIATILFLVNPLLNQLSYSTFAEVPSTFFILLGIYLCVLIEVQKNIQNKLPFFIGIFIGIGFLIKYSNFIFIIPTVLYFLLQKRLKTGITILFGFTTIILIGGLSDYLIYGDFFHSFFASHTYANNNDSVRLYEFFPFNYYLVGLSNFFSNLELALLLVSIGVVVPFKILKPYGLILLCFISQLFILSSISYKQYRYLATAVPLVNILCSIALVTLLQYLQDFKKINKFSYLLIVFFLYTISLFHLQENRLINLAPFKSGIEAIEKILSKEKRDNLTIAAAPWTIGKEFYFTKDFTILDADPGLFKDYKHISDLLNKSDYFITFNLSYYDQDKKIRKLLTELGYIFISDYNQFSIYKNKE